jgi:hypothetical protein
MFKLRYEIVLKNETDEKALIDAVRVRNGNLEVALYNGREDGFNEL